MDAEKAELIAINALTWVLQNPSYLSSFIGITGVTPIDFRKHATETEFLGSILDFVLSKDKYTLEFCASHDYEQESISIARQFLPGSHLPNWT